MMEEPAKGERLARTILIKEWLKALGVWIGLGYVGLPLFWYPFIQILRNIGDSAKPTEVPPTVGLNIGLYRTIAEVLSLLVLFFIGYTIRNLWKQRQVATLHLVLLTIDLSLGALAWCSFYIIAHFGLLMLGSMK